MRPRTPWTLKWLRQKCSEYRAHLAEHALATSVELADHWPGGEENREGGLGGWIYCYGSYRAFLLRMDAREGYTSVDQDKAEQAAEEAIQEVPIAVPLQDGGGVSVYPKSYEVIAYVTEMDIGARWLLARSDALIKADTAASVLRGQNALEAVSRIHLLMCWVACTPGCESPYPPEKDPPALPDTFRNLSPLDIVRILAGYLEVNRTRIALTAELLHSVGEKARRLNWMALASDAATHLNLPIERLVKRRSLGAWVGQFVLHVKSEMDRADRARADEEPTRDPAAPDPVN